MAGNVLMRGMIAISFPPRIPPQGCQMPSPFALHRFPLNRYPFQACTHPLRYHPIARTTLQSLSGVVRLRQTNTPGSGVGFRSARKSIWNIPPSLTQLR